MAHEPRNWLSKVLPFVFTPEEAATRHGDSAPIFVGDKEPQFGDLVVTTVSHTRDRAKRAMPSTSALKPILELIPPPPVPIDEMPSELRDYGPNALAEHALRFPASRPFSCKNIHQDALSRREEFLHPTLYCITPEGRTTYLVSGDGPTHGVSLIVAWSLERNADTDSAAFAAAGQRVADWLAGRPEQFDTKVIVDPEFLARQRDQVRQIMAATPDRVGVDAFMGEGEPWFDGKMVWNTLHAMGFRWGDMDCFQWIDPTGQTDYLIWVDVDDDKYGYALPEEIAAGRQNFNTVTFSFSPARSPAPQHVLDELVRAAECFQRQTGCFLLTFADDDEVDSVDVLREKVSSLVAELERLGVKPGSSEVCGLR